MLVNFQNHSIFKSQGINMFPGFGTVFVFPLCYCCSIVWGPERFQGNPPAQREDTCIWASASPWTVILLNSGTSEGTSEHHWGPTRRWSGMIEALPAKLGSSCIEGILRWTTRVPGQSDKAVLFTWDGRNDKFSCISHGLNWDITGILLSVFPFILKMLLQMVMWVLALSGLRGVLLCGKTNSETSSMVKKWGCSALTFPKFLPPSPHFPGRTLNTLNAVRRDTPVT